VVRAMGLVRGGCPFEDACLRICLVGGRDVLLVWGRDGWESEAGMDINKLKRLHRTLYVHEPELELVMDGCVD